MDSIFDDLSPIRDDRGPKSLPSSPLTYKSIKRVFTLEETLIESKNIIAELVRKIEILENENENLRENSEEFEEHYNEISERNKSVKLYFEKLEDENKELRNTLDLNNLCVDNLVNQVNSTKSSCLENKKLKNQNLLLSKNVRRMVLFEEESTKKMELLTSENTSLKDHLDEKNKIIKTLKEQLKNNSSIDNSLTELQSKATSLETKYIRKKSNYEKKIGILEDDLSKENTRFSELLENSDFKIIREKKKNENLEKLIGEMKITIEELELYNDRNISEINEIRVQKMMDSENLREKEMQKCLDFLERNIDPNKYVNEKIRNSSNIGINKSQEKAEVKEDDDKNMLNYREVYLRILEEKVEKKYVNNNGNGNISSVSSSDLGEEKSRNNSRRELVVTNINKYNNNIIEKPEKTKAAKKRIRIVRRNITRKRKVRIHRSFKNKNKNIIDVEKNENVFNSNEKSKSEVNINIQKNKEKEIGVGKGLIQKTFLFLSSMPKRLV